MQCSVFGFLLLTLSATFVRSEYLSVIKLPSCLKLGDNEGTAVSSGDFDSLVKGIMGVPTDESLKNIDLTNTCGLKTPKAFLFLRLLSEQPVTSKPFTTFNLKDTGATGLRNLVLELREFYGKSAHVLDLSDDENQFENAQLDFGLTQLIEIAKTFKLQSQFGPLFIFSPNMTVTVGSLEKHLTSFKEIISDIFGEDVAVFGITMTPSVLSRVRRAVTEPSVSADLTPKDLNIGEDYSEDYPVIFNIILWFMIGMAITIASVTYCIWFMDPGKDGIIYRMTASRVKKDL